MARKRTAAAKVAYEAILEKILSFDLPPEATVSDTQLAAELKMSRTPVREAMVRLTVEGLIEQGESSMFVKPMTATDIRELLEVRDALESKAVELIMAKGGVSKASREQLLYWNDQMRRHVESNDFALNFQADDQFHKLLISYACNSRLNDYANQLRLQIHRVRWLTIIQPDYISSVEEHQAIIDALGEGDTAVALEAIKAHIRHAKENFHAVIHDEHSGGLMNMITHAALTLGQ